MGRCVGDISKEEIQQMVIDKAFEKSQNHN